MNADGDDLSAPVENERDEKAEEEQQTDAVVADPIDPDYKSTPTIKQVMAAYNSWDPLREEDDSFFNSLAYKSHNASSLVTGESGSDLSTSDIQCPFYDGTSDKCFKVKCLYKHDKLLAEALATNNTKYINSLTKATAPVVIPEQLKPKQFAPEGSFITVNMGAVISPSEFYVTPVSDWSCLCEKKDIKDCNDEYRHYGVENLTKMWEDLNYTALNKVRHTHYYSQGELVAVRIETTPRIKKWYRATVLEEVGIGETDATPLIHLKLIDFGTVVWARTKDVIPLPEEFLAYPPLAYKCSLFGISPITYKWSTKAVKLFRELVHEQLCLLEIKKAVPISTVSEPGVIFETNPYQVTLHVVGNGKYINAANLLIDEGLGLEWHPFPARPHILDALPEENARGFAYLGKPFGEQYPLANPKLPESVVKREIQRLRKYLNDMDRTEHTHKP